MLRLKLLCQAACLGESLGQWIEGGETPGDLSLGKKVLEVKEGKRKLSERIPRNEPRKATAFWTLLKYFPVLLSMPWSFDPSSVGKKGRAFLSISWSCVYTHYA